MFWRDFEQRGVCGKIVSMFGSYLETVFLFLAKRPIKHLTEFELIPVRCLMLLFFLLRMKVDRVLQ